MIATNELAACRPPSGTSVLRPTAMPRPQPQHPRSIAPRQSQSRTAYNPLAELLEDDLPAHCSPSQPPLPRVLRRTIESALGRPVKPGDDSGESEGRWRSILDPVAVQVIAVGVEPLLGAFGRGADPRHHPPEPRRVVHLDKMRHFMGGQIVEHEGRRKDQPP